MFGWGKRKLEHSLDSVLLKWTEYDPYRIRDLLNGGLLILGRAGGGKTSSSGRTAMQAIVDNRNSGGVILAAKPEDVGDVLKIFRKAGRLKDLMVFDERGALRCNFFGCMTNPRDVVTFTTTMGEVLKRGGGGGGGGENNRFFEQQEERGLYHAVGALQVAGEEITPSNIHKVMMTTATTPEELATPHWQSKYLSQVLERGVNAKKSRIQANDHQLHLDYFLKEVPSMDPKVRSNVLAGIQGTLFTMNSGLVREMTASEKPNCSPLDVLRGKWLLVNFPPSTYGATGLLISAAWKQLVQQAVLERHARDSSPFVTIWCDEAHQFVTGFDSSFIAQCRSHRGCMVYLTQSVSSFYAAMKGDSGRHQADALLANYSTVIIHSTDPVTAKWASSKLGRRKETLYSGSSSPPQDATVWDMLYGNNHVSASFSEHYEQVLQDDAFMVGRTGGPNNGYLADAIVIKSGETFSDGNSYKRVTFSQRG